MNASLKSTPPIAMSDKPTTPSDRPDMPGTHNAPDTFVDGMISLSEWLSSRYSGTKAPTITTARRWARTGLIHPAPEKHGREYFLQPTARYVPGKASHGSQRGMTLIELTLTLVIGSTIIASALAYGTNVMADAKISSETSSLKLLATRIENAFAGRTANYGLLTTNGNTFVINNIGLQNIFTVSGSTVTGSYGAITIGTGSDGPSAAAASSYQFTYASGVLSTAQCMSLVTSAAPTFKLVRIGTTVVKAATAVAANVALTKTACTAGGAVNFVGYIS